MLAYRKKMERLANALRLCEHMEFCEGSFAFRDIADI